MYTLFVGIAPFTHASNNLNLIIKLERISFQKFIKLILKLMNIIFNIKFEIIFSKTYQFISKFIYIIINNIANLIKKGFV
jgi:hypothetical protein